MPHSNPSDQELKELLTNATTIAIVGASSNRDKESYGIMQKLLRAGYHVVPVNPKETEILGQRSYPSLIDVPEPIDIVDVFRAPKTPRRSQTTQSPLARRRCGCRPASPARTRRPVQRRVG